MGPFTQRHAVAFAHYAEHRIKSQAFAHATDTTGMDKRTIWREGWKLFAHPAMKQAIKQLDAEVYAKAGIDAAWVLERATRLADFDISKFIRVDDDTGTAVYDFSAATDDDWYCISEYTADKVIKGAQDGKYEVERVKIKGHCKLRALELVGKHTAVQAFVEKVEHTGIIATVTMTTAEYKAARAEMLADDDC